MRHFIIHTKYAQKTQTLFLAYSTFPLLLGKMHPDLDTMTRTVGQGHAILDGTDLRAVDAVNTLNHANQDVSNLSKRKLLTYADTRSAVEGQVVPAGTSVLPPVWFPLICVFAPEIFAAVHEVYLAKVCSVRAKSKRLYHVSTKNKTVSEEEFSLTEYKTSSPFLT